MAEPKTITQCRTCPWRVGCDPLADIPGGYSVDLHQALADTIAEPGSLCPTKAGMACHYSEPGQEAERPCAGWLAHQLGPGNAIALRLAVMQGKLPVPLVDGPQHRTFQDTLPKSSLWRDRPVKDWLTMPRRRTARASTESESND